ncbi:putative regulator of chromosome condensation [Neospora caninum Liverpool]|uniref:Putative regulator of chromosome condensation n=1 Tax=Neospora caninum (strain Liverpool) TaxID=572307 RepID=F0VD57_NEOCL|nr:putative regulator of chromosome condensation [Neospora caninum Liverpool]CBZ51572.1 putative regulator of chromosome condensation [Neospora caninum Liverpool]|eukprot:XP_003881605.1 putative regulator of chromosome condensation [Neospora caninum Liverpool]
MESTPVENKAMETVPRSEPGDGRAAPHEASVAEASGVRTETPEQSTPGGGARLGDGGSLEPPEEKEGSQGNSTASASEPEWRCPICLVVNASTDLTCPCCEGPKPGIAPVSSASGRASSGASPFAPTAGSGFHLVSSVSASAFPQVGEASGAARRSEGFRPDLSSAPGFSAGPVRIGENVSLCTTQPFVFGQSGCAVGATAAVEEKKRRPSGFVPVLPASSPESKEEQTSPHNVATCDGDKTAADGEKENENAEEKEERERLAVRLVKPVEAEGKKSVQVPTAQVFMFGSGEMDQMPFWVGVEEEEDREVVKPRRVTDFDGKPVVRAASGAMHSAVLTADGRCWTFGCSDGGALGRGDDLGDDALSPAVVPVGGSVSAVACGDSHTAFLTRHGRLYLAGTYRDSYGALGFPDFAGAASGGAPAFIAHHALPALVFSGFDRPRISQVACGENHTAALEAGGGAFYVWGSNEFGQLGVSSSRSASSAAQAGDSTDAQVAPQGGEAALRDKLEFLRPMRRTLAEVPAAIPDRLVQHIFCGRCTTFLALGSAASGDEAKDERNGDVGIAREEREEVERALLGCGRNSQGEVGCGSAEGPVVDHFVEVKKLRNTPLKFVGGGQFFSVALRTDGLLYTWGQSDFTGHGCSKSYGMVEEPQILEKLERHPLRWVQCGSDHCVAVTEAGCLYTWGAGQNFQLGNGQDVEIRPSRHAWPSSSLLKRRTPIPTPLVVSCVDVTEAHGGSQHSMVLCWSGEYATENAEEEDQEVTARRKRQRPDTDEEEEDDAERESKRRRSSALETCAEAAAPGALRASDAAQVSSAENGEKAATSEETAVSKQGRDAVKAEAVAPAAAEGAEAELGGGRTAERTGDASQEPAETGSLDDEKGASGVSPSGGNKRPRSAKKGEKDAKGEEDKREAEEEAGEGQEEKNAAEEAADEQDAAPSGTADEEPEEDVEVDLTESVGGRKPSKRRLSVRPGSAAAATPRAQSRGGRGLGAQDRRSGRHAEKTETGRGESQAKKAPAGRPAAKARAAPSGGKGKAAAAEAKKGGRAGAAAAKREEKSTGTRGKRDSLRPQSRARAEKAKPEKKGRQKVAGKKEDGKAPAKRATKTTAKAAPKRAAKGTKSASSGVSVKKTIQKKTERPKTPTPKRASGKAAAKKRPHSR